MIIVPESASALKGFLSKSFDATSVAHAMVLRVVVAFLMRRGRMTCSQAAGSVASEAIHRGQLTRFLARPRWQKHDFNGPLRAALLNSESRRGKFIFLIDATLVSQAGKKTENTFSTGNRGRTPAKGRRLGLPVTSTLMESLVKQFNARVKGTEKFWNDPAGAKAILTVRASLLSEDGRFNEFFDNRPGCRYRRRSTLPQQPAVIATAA
jgi:hypothetical protein